MEPGAALQLEAVDKGSCTARNTNEADNLGKSMIRIPEKDATTIQSVKIFSNLFRTSLMFICEWFCVILPDSQCRPISAFNYEKLTFPYEETFRENAT